MGTNNNLEINPIHYGALCQKVDEMTKKVDKLEENMEKLIELSNKSRGGFWVGIAIISGASTVISYFINIFHI